MKSFWNPKGKKSNKFVFDKLKPGRYFKASKYPIRSVRENRLISKNPYGDSDHDKVMNYFDCKPLVRRKQDFMSNAINAAQAAKQQAMETIKAGAEKIKDITQPTQQPTQIPVKPGVPGFHDLPLPIPPRPKLPVPPNIPLPPKLPIRPPKLPPNLPIQPPKMPRPPIMPIERPKVVPAVITSKTEYRVKTLPTREITNSPVKPAPAGTHWETMTVTKNGITRRVAQLVDNATGKYVPGPMR